MAYKREITDDYCGNCNAPKRGEYCSNCGQKFLTSNKSIKAFIAESVDTIFNIDNRLFRTLKELFLKPGSLTTQYLSGKRARFIPPIKIYFSFSVLYFLVLSATESQGVLFINKMEMGGYEKEFVNFLKSAMILLIPGFAWVIFLIHKKQRPYYVDSLVFALHLHAIFFFLFSVRAITDHYLTTSESFISGLLLTISSVLAAILLLFYLFKSVKIVFGQTTGLAILKSILILFGYSLLLALSIVIFIFGFTR